MKLLQIVSFIIHKGSSFEEPVTLEKLKEETIRFVQKIEGGLSCFFLGRQPRSDYEDYDRIERLMRQTIY